MCKIWADWSAAMLSRLARLATEKLFLGLCDASIQEGHPVLAAMLKKFGRKPARPQALFFPLLPTNATL
jgi:hypothetical protein